MSTQTLQSSAVRTRLISFSTLIIPVLLAACCLWMARPQAASSKAEDPEARRSIAQTAEHSALQPKTTPATHNGAASPEHVATSLRKSPKLITLPIEQITPGMRVLAGNPELTESLPDSDVKPERWRFISLEMQKETGGTLHVQLLRPIDWLITEAVILIATTEDPQSLYPKRGANESQTLASEIPSQTSAADALQRLLLNQKIHLDLPELGAVGFATVTAIDPCPPVDEPEAGRRLVTGTFRHTAANVIDVQVGGETEPFGCTDNHPFWSVDREQFVEAGQLRIGENLQSADGTLLQVTRITPRRGPPVDVFNFEVDVEHVYHVGNNGVLVHNACALPITRAAQHGSRPHHGNMVMEALLVKGRAGVSNVRTNQALSNGTATISNLKPDVQYMQNGLIHVIEINRSGGPGYHRDRIEELRSALGAMFGSYKGIDI